MRSSYGVWPRWAGGLLAGGGGGGASAPPEPPTLLEQLVAMYAAAGGAVFTADNYVESAGKVYGLVDHCAVGHVLQQATASRQCALPSASATLGGKLVLNFTGAAWYDSNNTPAYWSGMHNGTGGEMAAVYVVKSADLGFIWSDINNSGLTYQGAHFSTEANAARFQIYNTGSPVCNLAVAASMWAQNTAYFAACFFSVAENPDFGVYNNASVLAASGNRLGQEAAENSLASMRLGAPSHVTTNRFVGEVRALLYMPRVLTPEERMLRAEWVASDVGIAA